ncbi:MAG: hypothetical protein JXQ73_12510 [Phycisphaerae bacterium]|nr:hypothetical protein [Phycisphaerae bacterium]
MMSDAANRIQRRVASVAGVLAGAFALAWYVGCSAPEPPAPRIQPKVVSSAVNCRIVSASDEVVEGGEFEVVVAVTLPPSRKLVQLSCEIKGGGVDVIRAHRRMVQGMGEHRFAFDAPPRSQCSSLTAYAWLGTDWRTPLAPVVQSKPITIVAQDKVAHREQAEGQAPKLLSKLAYKRSDKGNVALLSGDWPGQDQGVIAALESAMRSHGFEVTRIDAQAFLNPYTITPERFDVLIATGVGHLPVASSETLGRYVRGGGNFVALGTPMFTDPVFRLGGRWIPASGLSAELRKTPTSKMLFDFEGGDLKGWTRSSNDPKNKTTYEPAGGGASGSQRCLHVKMDSMTGWETIHSSVLPKGAVPDKQVMTCFWAKGSAATNRLAIEWNEQDGSRWIGTISLKPGWQYYVLPPETFVYWRDSSSKGRGGAGDRFNPANAQRIGFGLAFTHTGHLGGAHEFWIDQVGVAPSPWGEVTSPVKPEFPRMDLLWPSYKYYETKDVARIQANRMQRLISPTNLRVPNGLRCPHQRPQGTGFNKGRGWRMITVAEAVGGTGDFRGPALSVMVDQPADGRARAWAALGSDDVSFLKSPQTLDALADVTARMVGGVFLLEGGSEFYTYFQGESIRLGARVVNVRRASAADVGVRIRVLADEAEVFGQSFAGAVKAGEAPTVFQCVWGPDRLRSKGYAVEVELTRAGQVVDRLVHELGVWEPKAKPQFVTARDGDFHLAGKKWYPFGVNHMPASGIGMEDGNFFEQYLGSRAYDPEIFDRELARIKGLGMNMVSEFLYHQSHTGRNVIDLLRRCDKYGLKMNLSLRPGTPMDFEWDKMRQMIVENRLAENDTVFAYDLAWEPFVGTHAQRRRWDREWGEWVQRRYGTVAGAEKAWGFKAPKDEKGFVTNPLDPQCGGDGAWSKMVIDYRRFIDELAHKHYAEARRLVRTVDANHLVSFRMTVAGDPTFNQAGNMPFDFRSLKNAVDLFEPEGYGRIGDWQRVRPGWFTAAYARSVDASKPVMWAEYGVSSWNMAEMATSESGLAFEAKFYDDFLKMVQQSGSNGAVCWWYPGGYRVGEDSDFGIVNPDGTDRPVARVLRKYGEWLARSRAIPKPEVWIEYDPDDPAGVQGIYDKVGKQFWAAVDAGKVPGLRAKK